MKKLSKILLCLVLILSLSACSSSSDEDKEEKSSKNEGKTLTCKGPANSFDEEDYEGLKDEEMTVELKYDKEEELKKYSIIYELSFANTSKNKINAYKEDLEETCSNSEIELYTCKVTNNNKTITIKMDYDIDLLMKYYKDADEEFPSMKKLQSQIESNEGVTCKVK